MLRCAVAFLLITGKGSNHLDRLVVTTEDDNKLSYGVYEVKARDHFPHSEYIDQSVLTRTKITGKGTYYMPYCSKTLYSSEIGRIITKGLTDITHQTHVDPTDNRKKEESCLKSLSAMVNVEQERNVIDISKCNKNVRKVCTSHIIQNLAFKGIIAVDGPYRAFSPRMAEQPIVVIHDQPTDMKSLVLNGEVFVISRTELEQNALAWYQGHLHLFKQSLITKEWSPVTLIGSEWKNGPLITNHILKALPDSKIQWSKFYDLTEEIFRPYNSWNYRESSTYDNYSREIYSFLNSDELYSDKPIFTYPFLDFNDNHYSRYDVNRKPWILSHLLSRIDKQYHRKFNTFRATGTLSPLEEN